MILRRLALLSATTWLFAGLSGCATRPALSVPKLAATVSYGSLPSDLDLTVQDQAPEAWWQSFGATALEDLIQESLRANPNLRAAQAALRAAHDLTLAQRGAFLPAVSLSVAPSRQKIAPTLASPAQSGAGLYSLTTSQVSVSYTPDLFGANARALDGLVAAEDQQRYEVEAARLSLAANVTVAAMTEAALRAQAEEAEAVVRLQKNLYASALRQRSVGQLSDADSEAAATTLAAAEAQTPPIRRQLAQAQDLLTALVGRTPDRPAHSGLNFADLKTPSPLPLITPARLVAQRPDVRLAGAALRSAGAAVGVAHAARLPSLDLSAAFGGAALKLSPQFGGSQNFWVAAGELSAPLFQGGALMRKEAAARNLYTGAGEQYQAAVIAAFQNVADTLAALQSDAEALRAANATQTSADHVLAIAKAQLQAGDISANALLQAEITARQAKIALLQARLAQLSDVVALYQALGGGWRDPALHADTKDN